MPVKGLALVDGWQRDPAALDLLLTALRELVPADLPITVLCRTALATYAGNAAQLIGARLLAHLPTHEPSKESRYLNSN